MVAESAFGGATEADHVRVLIDIALIPEGDWDEGQCNDTAPAGN